jgi:DNA-binding ferritin-like protein
MQDIATQFRAMQFIAHRAHNLASGPTFFEDHEYFGELYAAYEAAYDATIERIIGIGGTPDIGKITYDAVSLMVTEPAAMAVIEFGRILVMESELRIIIDAQNEGASLGVQNMLQQFADDSQARSYKIGQRIK